MNMNVNISKLAFFINIGGQIVDTNGNIIGNNTSSLPTEIIENICSIANELYFISSNYELHKVKFPGSYNYVVGEFTVGYVRINGIIYNLLKDYSSAAISSIPPRVIPNDIHNIDRGYIVNRTLSGGVVYDDHIMVYIFVDTNENLVAYNTQNSEHMIIKTNVTCNKIFIIGNKHNVLFTLVLICDNKIIQLSYKNYDQSFTITHNKITPTPFTINKIYFGNDDKTQWKIIDDNYNVYDARIDISATDANICIEPFQFNYKVADIIYDEHYKNLMYLSVERLLCDSEGALITNEMLTRKITVPIKSANSICCN